MLVLDSHTGKGSERAIGSGGARLVRCVCCTDNEKLCVSRDRSNTSRAVCIIIACTTHQPPPLDRSVLRFALRLQRGGPTPARAKSDRARSSGRQRWVGASARSLVWKSFVHRKL